MDEFCSWYIVSAPMKETSKANAMRVRAVLKRMLVLCDVVLMAIVLMIF
jgi:hypothetical protein